MNDFHERIILPLGSSARITWRTESAYNDLLKLQEISEDIEAKLSGVTSADLPWFSKLTTLLKAHYVLADVFVRIFLGEATGKNDLSLHECLTNKYLPKLSLEDILPAYAVITYRNKVIVHHDSVRNPASFTVDENPKEYRLLPLPLPAGNIVQNDELNTLWNKYQSSMLEQQPADNFDGLRILFASVPITLCPHPQNIKRLKICGDRETIDGIAETGGCLSMTRQEILSAIDQFALAVVNAVV